MEEIQRSLGRIEGKVEKVDSHVEAVRQKQDELDVRLRQVEKMSTFYGAISGGLIAFIVTLLKEFILKNR